MLCVVRMLLSTSALVVCPALIPETSAEVIARSVASPVCLKAQFSMSHLLLIRESCVHFMFVFGLV